MEVIQERNAAAHFIAPCIFPDAERVVHKMDALMAHGLTPEEAVDVIVKGILR